MAKGKNDKPTVAENASLRSRALALGVKPADLNDCCGNTNNETRETKAARMREWFRARPKKT